MEESAKVNMCPRCFTAGLTDPQIIAQMIGASEERAAPARAGGTDIRWELRTNRGALDLFLTWIDKAGQPCERWRASFA